MSLKEKINYLEFPAQDIALAKKFFGSVFDWEFVDYGPDYSAFSNSGIEGGFFRSEKIMSTDSGSALVIFYSEDLESTQERVQAAGGSIKQNIFSFPGGRRFHFCDPNGNEFSVWSDAKVE